MSSLVEEVDRMGQGSTAVIDTLDGQPLARDSRGRYAAIYVRVSSEQQRGDGWSVQDQTAEGIAKCVSLGLAFRIFSDAGLSGGLPINDLHLLQRAYAVKARNYREAYTSVFLDRARRAQEPPHVLASMEAHLESAVQDIRAGRCDDWTRFESSDAELGSMRFRPALTDLMAHLGQIHTIVINDWSRISRNYALSLVLLERTRNRVKFLGTSQDLGYFDGESVGDELAQMFLSWMAATHLRQITIDIMRGFYQNLSAGNPHGKLPAWCDRQGRSAVINPERATLVLDAIERFLAGESIRRIAQTTPGPSPTGHARWNVFWVSQMLASKTLIGIQTSFGREWAVLPPLIDTETFTRIQMRRAALQPYHRPEGNVSSAMLSGLILCACGSKMVHHADTKRGLRVYHCTYKKSSAEHIRLSAPNVEEFVSALVREHSSLIPRQSETLAPLQESLQSLRLALAQAEDSDKALAAAQAAQVAQMLGEEMTAADIEARLRKIQAPRREEIKRLEDEITLARFKARTGSADEATTEERISRWDALTSGQQNEVLCDLFECFRCTQESMIPVLRTGELPGAPFEVTALKRGRRIRLPSLAGYIESIIEQKVDQAQGGLLGGLAGAQEAQNLAAALPET